MEEILHQLVGSFSHYYRSQVVSQISAINSTMGAMGPLGKGLMTARFGLTCLGPQSAWMSCWKLGSMVSKWVISYNLRPTYYIMGYLGVITHFMVLSK